MIAITIAACAGFLAGAIIQAKIEDHLRNKWRTKDELH